MTHQAARWRRELCSDRGNDGGGSKDASNHGDLQGEGLRVRHPIVEKWAGEKKNPPKILPADVTQ